MHPNDFAHIRDILNTVGVPEKTVNREVPPVRAIVFFFPECLIILQTF